jgi:hypothetical protein
MTRTIITQDGQPVGTKLEQHGSHLVAVLEFETFAARVPLTPFIATLLAAKVKKGIQA